MIIKQVFTKVKNNVGLALMIILGLTLSFACSLFIFLWVREELEVDKFHTDASYIYQLYTDYLSSGSSTITRKNAFYPAQQLIDERVPGIAATMLLNASQADVGHDRDIFLVNGYYASNDFFSFFSFPLLVGSKEEVLADIYGIVLSRKQANKIFGEVPLHSVLGESLLVNGINVFVSGIFEDVGENSSLQFDFVLNMELNFIQYPWNKEFGNHNHLLFAKFNQGLDAESAAASMNLVVDELMGKNPNKPRFWFYPFSKTYLYSNVQNGIVQGGRVDYIYLLVVIGFLIVVLSILNQMNLLLAKNIRYLKELAIRRYLGMAKRSNVLSALLDSFWMTSASLIFSFSLFLTLTPSIQSISGRVLEIPWDDLSFWVETFAFLIVVTLIAGLYPLLSQGSFQVTKALKSNYSFSRLSLRLNRSLVLIQFFLCMILVVGAFLTRSQIEFVMNMNLGFDTEKILVYPVRQTSNRTLETLKDQLKEDRHVLAVSGLDQKPMQVNSKNASVRWEGMNDNETVELSHLGVDFDFLKAFNIELVSGRGHQLTTDSSDFLINESAAKEMGLENPIGVRVEGLGKRGKIIGVVKDFHNQLLYSPITPMIMHIKSPNFLFLKIDNVFSMETLKRIHSEHFPGHSFDYYFLDQEIQQMYGKEMFMAGIVDSFAVIALIVSALGLFSLVSFSTQNRYKEVGIRKVFGATSLNVMMHFMVDYLKIVITASILAVPLVYVLSKKWLSHFAYSVDFSVLTFFIPCFLIVFVSTCVISFQVIKASNEDPVKVLRYE